MLAIVLSCDGETTDTLAAPCLELLVQGEHRHAWVLVLTWVVLTQTLTEEVPVQTDGACVKRDLRPHTHVGELTSFEFIPNADATKAVTSIPVAADHELDPLHMVVPRGELYLAEGTLWIFVAMVSVGVRAIESGEPICPAACLDPVKDRDTLPIIRLVDEGCFGEVIAIYV